MFTFNTRTIQLNTFQVKIASYSIYLIHLFTLMTLIKHSEFFFEIFVVFHSKEQEYLGICVCMYVYARLRLLCVGVSVSIIYKKEEKKKKEFSNAI